MSRETIKLQKNISNHGLLWLLAHSNVQVLHIYVICMAFEGNINGSRHQLEQRKEICTSNQLIFLLIHREDSCYRVHIEQKYCTQKLELKLYIGDNECKPSIPENLVVLG